MAFRNSSLPSTSFVAANIPYSLYTCPATHEAVVHALYISNVSSSKASITVDVMVAIKKIVNSTPITVHLLKEAQIIYGTTLIFDKPINLRAGDFISVQCNTASAVEVNASILLTALDTTVSDVT